MSPIDFERLSTDYPEQSASWAALREWFDRNWRKQYVELTVLVRALKGKIEPTAVLAAIRIMISRSMLAVAWRVKSPSGYLLEGDFDEPDQIPEEMWDRDSSRKIPIDEAELVSGYRWDSTYAA